MYLSIYLSIYGMPYLLEVGREAAHVLVVGQDLAVSVTSKASTMHACIYAHKHMPTPTRPNREDTCWK